MMAFASVADLRLRRWLHGMLQCRLSTVVSSDVIEVETMVARKAAMSVVN